MAVKATVYHSVISIVVGIRKNSGFYN